MKTGYGKKVPPNGRRIEKNGTWPVLAAIKAFHKIRTDQFDLFHFNIPFKTDLNMKISGRPV